MKQKQGNNRRSKAPHLLEPIVPDLNRSKGVKHKVKKPVHEIYRALTNFNRF